MLAAAVRDGVRLPDANQGVFEVDAFLVALAVEDLMSGRPSVRVEPSPAGGPIGYVISGLREGSPYVAIGLQDGDIIEAINDVPLDAPERGLTALAGSQRGARLQIVRAGVGMTRELRVVDGLAWAQVLAQRAGVAPPEPPPAIEPAVLEDMPVAEPGGSTPVASRPGGARRPGDAAYQPPSGSSGASAPAASRSIAARVRARASGSGLLARMAASSMHTTTAKFICREKRRIARRKARCCSTLARSRSSTITTRGKVPVTLAHQ